MDVGKAARFLVFAVSACFASVQAVRAEQPFYKGKTVTIFINFAVGGPTDIEGRLFAKWIGRHIDGKPTVIVQNMEGAGGMAGANHLGTIAPRDGTVIGYFSSVPWIYSILPGERRIAFETFDFLAYQPGTAIHYVRTDVKPGIRKAEDIQGAQNLVVGGLSQDNAKDVMMRLTLDMLGVHYKYVTGYAGSAGVQLAFQRGEVNFYSESPAVYRSMVDPLVKRGEVVPLYYDPGYVNGQFSLPTQMEGLSIPSFTDFYQKLKGAAPAGPLWQAYLAALAVNNATQRIVVMPPNSPPAAQKAVQAAIREMQNDKGYMQEALQRFGYVPRYVGGPDANDTVRRALYVKPDVRKFIQAYIASRPQ